MQFTVTRIPGLPALAWAAEIRSDLSISAICGAAVETDDCGLIAGAWTGDFCERRIAEAPTSIGTALRVRENDILAHCGTAGSATIFVSRAAGRLVVSNSLSFALAKADDRLDVTNPYYFNDLCTFFYGADRYRHTLRTERGRLSFFYSSMSVGRGRRIVRATLAHGRVTGDFRSYRAYLVDETTKLFANAADPKRRQRFLPLATVSSGYDSTACAVIAHEAGCREGITFGESIESPHRPDDSGHDLGTRIGLEMSEYGTFAHRQRNDLSEIEFVASGFTSGQVFLSNAGSALAGRLIVSGLGGDWVWDPTHGRRRKQHVPFFIGGYSEVEMLLRAPALSLALAMIGIRRMDDLDRLSISPAMKVWSIGGDYDRPIPRRIVEEAGISRGDFAVVKRRVGTDFFGLTRRAPDLGIYFSKHSIDVFEAWLARERPMRRARLVRHRLIADTIGRLLWSGKLHRTLTRVGLRWPPLPHRLLRYKVPITKNCYVFNWAVSCQTERYRTILTGG
jgi:hypothetical protein